MNRLTDRRSRTDPSAVQLIEEAIHLLRQAPLSSWIGYGLGSSVWVVGFLFFWARTTWFAPSGAAVSWSALGLAGLFVVLKTAQSDFCARLLAQRLGLPPAPFTVRGGVRLAAAQAQLQCGGLILLPVALVLSVPFGWVFAFFQTATVLGAGEALGSVTREAAAEGRRWPGQNHLGLTYLTVIGGAAWINLAAALVGIPWLAHRLLGLQTIFDFGGMWWLNTTFLASVTALTWLAVDPLVKAFYVLRVFYGRSQHTGEDLRVELLLSNRRPRAGGAALALALLILLAVRNPLQAEAAPPLPPSHQAVDPAALDRAIDQVLTQRDFQWQLRPKALAGKKDQEGGAIRRFLREGIELVKTMVNACVDTYRAFEKWIHRLFPGKDDAGEASGPYSGISIGILRLLLYGLIVTLIAAILVVGVLMLRKRSSVAPTTLTARAVTNARPDLRDDQLEAAHLPTEGWVALAREQIANGEWRLALRALYLATLARLAAEGLVTLAKSKTNLDYERELRRRLPANESFCDDFRSRRREFEAVWYGRGVAGEERVRHWFEEIQRAAPR